MNKTIIEIRGHKLELLSQRACFWLNKSTLFLSDLHLGKAGHFRKHGIPVSRKVHLEDLRNLEKLIGQFEPKRILLLGDLFHSYENNEWQDFIQLLNTFSNIEFILVQGNHDILEQYPKEITLFTKYIDPPFSFTHSKKDCKYYNISGHIHPGITIHDKKRQSITLPCFVFSNNYAIIPAFGLFTGVKKIKPKATDRTFAIADRQVIELTQIISNLHM